MPSSSFSTLSFQPSTPNINSRFAPRLGKASFKRENNAPAVEVDTPGFITTTSRGVIPHLSRDHYKLTKVIHWVLCPFETFLEHAPPVPTLQGGPTPLHTFLGYAPSQNLLVMSARDPSDGRGLPSNGNDHISTYSLRGVRKISPSAWRSYVLACKPDVVVALSDTPYTKPPHSQKRLTKSLERSTSWLSNILRPIKSEDGLHLDSYRLNVFVLMAGGASLTARSAFSDSLMETLHGNEAETIKPFKCLDDGVAGYTFDLVPLRLSLGAETDSVGISPPDVLDIATLTAVQASVHTSKFIPLIKASLAPLSTSKLRIVNSTISPHEVLRLIRSVGIDMFDANWAQRAADIGIALDFIFPVTADFDGRVQGQKRDIGHNLYDQVYAHDFKRFADSFVDGASSLADSNSSNMSVCLCAACSPVSPSTPLVHSCIDSKSYPVPKEHNHSDSFLPSFTRAYLHHLLHTHEMSAHTLLVMHNLCVLDAFFAGIRATLAYPDGVARFEAEVDKFAEVYDEDMKVFDAASRSWADVELARGKGRLAREKAKQAESTLGPALKL